MKIAFDLTPIYDHLTGVERYNINITKNVIANHPENNYILLFKNEVHTEFVGMSRQNNVRAIVLPACNKFLFIQFRLYRKLKELEADYYVFLSFTGPVLLKKDKILNAIHDLTCWDCPETMPLKMKFYYRWTNKVIIKRSWRIITVSRFSQERICEKYGLSKEKVLVIYDGLTDIFSERSHSNSDLKNKYKLPDKYILSLSTIEPRKNLRLLIDAYNDFILDRRDIPDLVLAGREGWNLEGIVGNIIDDTQKKIHFTGFIEDDDLAQIYREAELFVFPSIYEGFGLPVIEAMSQGTLVVCSDAASLPEVAGDAGILFRTNNKESLKECMLMGLNMQGDDKLHRIEKGRMVSRSFSWENEAEKLHQIFCRGS